MKTKTNVKAGKATGDSKVKYMEVKMETVIIS
jgi:hypothetical protein